MEPFLAEQIAYYQARASEYDEWFLRQGRYDRGETHRKLWFDEVATVEAALAEAAPCGDVLELACGTGIWTQRLAATATRLTAVDASSEVIAFNEARLRAPHPAGSSPGARVEYVQADLFEWRSPTTYDFIFFGFWLSHVPDARFEAFWDMVRRALRPSGTVFFVDSLAAPEAIARDQVHETDGIVERRLNDGRTFRIVKIFHEPTGLNERLTKLGWKPAVKATPNFFVYGAVRGGGDERAGTDATGGGDAARR